MISKLALPLVAAPNAVIAGATLPSGASEFLADYDSLGAAEASPDLPLSISEPAGHTGNCVQVSAECGAADGAAPSNRSDQLRASGMAGEGNPLLASDSPPFAESPSGDADPVVKSEDSGSLTAVPTPEQAFWFGAPVPPPEAASEPDTAEMRMPAAGTVSPTVVGDADEHTSSGPLCAAADHPAAAHATAPGSGAILLTADTPVPAEIVAAACSDDPPGRVQQRGATNIERPYEAALPGHAEPATQDFAAAQRANRSQTAAADGSGVSASLAAFHGTDSAPIVVVAPEEGAVAGREARERAGASGFVSAEPQAPVEGDPGTMDAPRGRTTPAIGPTPPEPAKTELAIAVSEAAGPEVELPSFTPILGDPDAAPFSNRSATAVPSVNSSAVAERNSAVAAEAYAQGAHFTAVKPSSSGLAQRGVDTLSPSQTADVAGTAIPGDTTENGMLVRSVRAAAPGVPEDSRPRSKPGFAERPALAAAGAPDVSLGADRPAQADVAPDILSVAHSPQSVAPPASVPTTPGAAAMSLTPAPLPPEVGPALADLASREGGVIELSLSPEELGGLTMRMERDGAILRVTVLADRPETLDLMRRHSEQLNEELRNAGFAGTSFTFADRGAGSGQPHQSTTASKEPSIAPAFVLPQPSRQAAPSAGLDLRM